MSEIGYYRYKTLADSERDVVLYINGVEAGRKTIKPMDFCEGDRILKYLDKNGQYRFFPFNKYYEEYDSPEQIGTTNKFITSILNAQTNKQNVGFKNDRRLDLTGEATLEQLEKLIDIYSSPRVYLYTGSGGSDADSDWLEVGIESSAPVIKPRKRKLARIDITITLPENFTIKMI